MRAIFDTNVLIDSAVDPLNAPSQLLEAVLRGNIIALVTEPIMKEYQYIAQNLILDLDSHERIEQFLQHVQYVNPVSVPLQIDDPADYKFLEAAVGGQAEYIVTSDNHLLQVGELNSIQIVKPTELHRRLQTKQGSTEWWDFIRGVGIFKE